MAVGQVSENPSSNAVTRPTVTETRDADIERKLRIYGIFRAFGNGKFPTNKQIDVALTSAVESDMLTNPSEQLSFEGRQLVKDLRDVIDSAKWLWLKKNYNEELQKFLWNTIQISTTPDSTNIDAPVSQDEAQTHANEALQHLRTLGRLLVTNGQFRKLLEDAILVLRDMAADGASQATQILRPDQERLDKIDAPAPDHQWHEAPPSISDIKDAAKRKIQKSQAPERAQEGAKGVARDASLGATGQPDPQEAMRRAADETVNQYSRGDVDQSAGARTGWESAKQRAKDQIPDEHLDRARDTKKKTMDYLNDKMPQERRDQAVYRLKKMVVECQQHEDYMEAIDALISLAEQYADHGASLAKDTTREAQRSADDTNLKKARDELKTLLENFADATSMDDMFDAAENLVRDANNDPEFTKWWKSLDHFIRRCLREDGFILDDESTEEWNRISERGNHFLNERYKEHTDRVQEEVDRWINYLSNDPDSVEFGNKVQKLFVDLGQDKNGNVKFKRHLLADVTDVIIPGFFENVRYVPIPRIEVSDPAVDAVVENLVIESENLMPNILEVEANFFYRMGRKKIHNKNYNRFSIHATQIQCDLKDVAYWIHKKQGFPTIQDTGVMDIFLGGEGLTLDMKFATAEEKDRNRIFKVENVTVKIKNLNIVLKQSTHKTLFSFFKPLLMAVVKPAIAKAAEVQIRKSFDQFDEQLWLVQNEYDKGKDAADQSPEDSPNMVTLYMQAIEKRFTELKRSAKQKKGDTKINFTSTKETSRFPDVHLPGGISSKAAEYREMAAKGNEWRSPVFDIGTAKPSKNVPAPNRITRKSPHQYTRATINDRPGTETAKGRGPQDSDFGRQSHNGTGYTSLGGYQPRMSTAADSMSTAVEQDDFEGTHVGKYTVTGSQAAQDPTTPRVY